ncbi:hypothetical protein AWC80_005663 [Escherichia coli]|nr:hypothetical protein [Escherichia coli]MDT3248298.1 hypothetical protein [Escherichia coli]SQK64406.1 Uncharacterised protein [Escherichia coli]SQL12134.1 Uncharacterised protein [Escherichia coli]SQL21886.1 Uncharacterised protein [Escherichia coli]
MLISPYLVWFHGAALTVMPHVLMAGSIIPVSKRRTGIAAARRAAKKRRRAKR